MIKCCSLLNEIAIKDKDDLQQKQHIKANEKNDLNALQNIQEGGNTGPNKIVTECTLT